ncbi:MAG TPA: hypothetical protein VH720_16220 [Candidatus Limnocylindrales bacterium]|jgi:hypothetical protein
MPTQKTFKRRVRARMTKTGESYTAARHQLLRKTGAPSTDGQQAPGADRPPQLPATELMTSANSMRRATGKGHLEWFTLLDAWGATDHTHTEIARWLNATHGVPGWWTQNITVNYERARGMRARHQMADGYSISVTRTIVGDPDRLLAAFTEEDLRRSWLPAMELRRRPTRAAHTARFDWPDPPSRLVAHAVPNGADRTLVSITHERLPDVRAADELKTAWRGWLGALKKEFER